MVLLHRSLSPLIIPKLKPLSLERHGLYQIIYGAASYFLRDI
jgi:hypothetical protein